MFSHKIFELLQTFSEEEIKRFDEFIKSPYFNKKNNTVRLYEEIIKNYPVFNNVKLSKKALYKRIFNTGNYKDSTLRVLIADLQILAQQFLAFENFKKDKLSVNNFMLEELLIRNQVELFLRNIKKINSELKELKQVDFDYLYNRYKLERNKFNFGIQNDKIIRKTNAYKQVESIYHTCTYLTIYYVTEIISEYIDLVIYSEKFNAKQVTGFINKLLGSVQVNKITHYLKDKNDCDFVLIIYNSLHSAFSDMENIEKYNNYKKLLETNVYRLSRDEISFHYSALVSYCILREKTGGYKGNFSEELLNLYETILENEYYKNKKENYLPCGLFRGVLFLARRLKKLDIISKLLKEYSGRLNPKEKYNMINFGYAFYYFETGDYERSMGYINKIRLDYFIYKYDVKNLMLRIYYELDYFEEAFSLIHTYKEFLRKDEFLSDVRKIRHKNFIKYLEMLILYRTNSLKAEINCVKRRLLRTEEVSYRNWLINKFNDCQKQKNPAGKL